ncbi:MAG: GNAT family N-acetyltransferase [Candidatus Levybacteria bacterium]|nr:GNAT family N-acetyltransferase [Candidatus Levybacteria bacterium]
MEITIEQIKTFSSDLTPALNSLLKQLNEEAEALDDKDVMGIIESSPNRLFVARSGREIIGMLTLIVFRSAFAKKGLLEDIVVDSKYRGKGVGTKIILAAIDEARREGVTHLDFTSSPQREDANRLYQHMGFEKRDTNVYRIKL